MKTQLASLALLLGVSSINPLLAHGTTQVSPEKALHMLHEQNQQFSQQVVQVSKNVYTAVGYHGANTSMIVGEDGIIIIDTLMGPTSAEKALKAFRAYTDKPVKAIIYTHSHGDHTGGASAFANNSQPDIYATNNFGIAEGSSQAVDIVKKQRNFRQFGRTLPKDQQTNRGVAPAGTYDKDKGKGFLKPTIKISQEGYKKTIAGVEVEFYKAPGETDDAMFIWLPKEKVLFTGDNFYHSFPNLYAIRGTTYRDVLSWSNSVAKMAKFKPEYVVPGHTLPIIGQSNSVSALNNYSEAIYSIYQQTVDGINQGKSPDLLMHQVKLPEHLKNKPYLHEFYGAIPHAVRAISTGLLGWFDGNPTHLNPLSPKQEAQKMAQLAGGTDALSTQMQKAFNNGQYQWALQLADYVKWLDKADKKQALAIKIKSLRALAKTEYNAPNRNYYLSYANELEAGQLNEVWF